VIEAPREVLRSSTTDLREMKRSKMNSFCCGGGGANVWYQVPE
jgi:Fe-S oxidoreductase